MDRILLVNPPETEQLGFTNPPLGLLYLAGMLLEHGFDVRLVDGCMEGKEAVRKSIADFHPVIVGITCLTPGRKKALEIADMVKAACPSAKVVLGGVHATIMHKQIMEHYPSVDCIVLGEGEHTLLELARGKTPAEIDGLVYRDGSGVVQLVRQRKPVENLDTLPFPAWNLIDVRKYPPHNDSRMRIVNGVNLDKEPRISVIFSRGCKGHCHFCSTWWIWRGWRRRSPRNMADEIEMLYDKFGVRHFCFADDALTYDRDATIDLLDEIISRGLKIAFQATTRTDCVDEVVLAKMKTAGCYSIAYGIETASPTLLDKMGKDNDVESSERAIRLTNKAGISSVALMIIGNVGETDDTINESIDFLKRAKPDVVACAGSLWVLPGTVLYQRCMQSGFIDDDFWLTDEPYKVYTQEHSLEKLGRYHRKVMWRCHGLSNRVLHRLRKLFNA